MTDDDDEVLRGELRDQLVGAMQRVPELAGRELILTSLSGGITNRNFLVTIPGESERYVIRLAGNDTHLLGISREVEHAATVAAAGVGVGPEVTAFIRPEGYLVTRFIEGSPVSFEQVRERATLARIADSLRRIHQGPADPRAVRAAPDRGGVSRAGDGPRRADPARVRARVRLSGAASSSPAWPTRSSCGRATTTC